MPTAHIIRRKPYFTALGAISHAERRISFLLVVITVLSFENVSLGGDAVVALGNFDGLHVGHKKVLSKALETANKKGFVPVALLFDEHPRKYTLGKRPPILMTDEMRDKKLCEMGFTVVKMSFTHFRDLAPDEFLLKIVEKLHVKAICCGFNYHYGKNGSGNIQTLEAGCRRLGIDLCWLPAAFYDGEPVSATRIREELKNGNMKAANAMLGRPFSYEMTVIEGDKRGRVLGFPTINQIFPDGFAVPKFGVYASKVCIDKKWYPSVTNIGIRPTIETEELRSETHIIGFSGDLYGKKVEVFLLEHTRPEKKFDGLDELAYTISCDVKSAERIYLENKGVL